jgi:hypothetical protein
MLINLRENQMSRYLQFYYVDLWFSLRFINKPLITILLGGFDIIVVELVVIVDATVDVVGSTVVVVFLTVDVSGSLSANINKNIIYFSAIKKVTEC